SSTISMALISTQSNIAFKPRAPRKNSAHARGRRSRSEAPSRDLPTPLWSDHLVARPRIVLSPPPNDAFRIVGRWTLRIRRDAIETDALRCLDHHDPH